MEHSAEALPVLTPAPQHLRRRRLYGEIPDPLLVPGAEPLPLEPGRASPNRAAPRRAAGTALKPTAKGTAPARRPSPPPAPVLPGRKRTAALVLVILVSLSIPALALALIFAG